MHLVYPFIVVPPGLGEHWSGRPIVLYILCIFCYVWHYERDFDQTKLERKGDIIIKQMAQNHDFFKDFYLLWLLTLLTMGFYLPSSTYYYLLYLRTLLLLTALS